MKSFKQVGYSIQPVGCLMYTLFSMWMCDTLFSTVRSPHLILHALLAAGEVACRCTTPDCQSEAKDTCQAQNMCYVQYMQYDTETPLVVRGCIDERTPLLCENRRPQGYRGYWPVLHCCKEERLQCRRDTDYTHLDARH